MSDPIGEAALAELRVEGDRGAIVEAAPAGPRAARDHGPIVEAAPARIDPEEILTVRRGPGANCSSIGSTLDVLFLSATVAGVILVSVAAALGDAKPAAMRETARGASGAKESEDEGAG